jgi:hypothetical protein
MVSEPPEKSEKEARKKVSQVRGNRKASGSERTNSLRAGER